MPASAISFQISRVGVARDRRAHQCHCPTPTTTRRVFVKKCGCLNDYRLLPPPSPSPLPSHRLQCGSHSNVHLTCKGRYSSRPSVQRQEAATSRRSQSIATSTSSTDGAATSMHVSSLGSSTRRPLSKLDHHRPIHLFNSDSFILKRKGEQEAEPDAEILESEEEDDGEAADNLFSSPSMLFADNYRAPTPQPTPPVPAKPNVSPSSLSLFSELVASFLILSPRRFLCLLLIDSIPFVRRN